jgi:Alcohol dehydrogenase GroES-like domain
VSWASEAVGAIRKMVLVEDRMERLASQTDKLATKCQEMDLRLAKMEAKFGLLERAATAGPRRLLPKNKNK